MIKQAGYKDTVQEYSYEPDTIMADTGYIFIEPQENMAEPIIQNNS